MKNILVFVFLYACAFSVSAQTSFRVEGNITDTTTNTKLQDVSISVLNSKDSILVNFSWTKQDGSFNIPDLPTGEFILLVTYPEYADYTERFTITPTKLIYNFGLINLTTKARLLKEVVINGQSPITIQGDTTNFNSKSFVVQSNSNVEDLLKQLPGIEVDKNGNITARGVAVNVILLDGEEFFSDDPTLITRNIRGDMVEKIQLYDKKSDQATFTGIDDGKKSKALNIVLKENKRTGYFGKVDAGIASDKFYQAQTMINMFTTARKIAAFTNIGNTGKVGLGSDDVSKYGVSSSVISTGVTISGASDELESLSGRYNGQGLPLARVGGAHYDEKWNSGKEIININYKIGSINVNGTTHSSVQNPLLSETIFSDNDQITFSHLFRQKLDGYYQTQLNKNISLRISADAMLKSTETKLTEIGTSSRDDISLLFGNARGLSNSGDQKIFNYRAFLSKRFAKERRTMSFTISGSVNNDGKDGFLISTNNFYNKFQKLDSIQHIDQYKTNFSTNNIFSSSATWTEPISKTFSMYFNYRFNVNSGTTNRKSFNKSIGGMYDILDKNYTNDFDFNMFSNLFGTQITYSKGKNNLNFGTSVNLVDYKQNDSFSGVKYKRNYLNWNPEIRYDLRSSQQKSFGIAYSGSTTQPAINQIQPLKINDDPLNISIGNPDLKVSFSNVLGFNYSSYKTLTSKSLSMNGYYSLTVNSIATNVITDNAGKRSIQWINIQNKSPQFFYLYTNYSKKLQISGLQIGISTSTSLGTNFNKINDELNQINRFNESFGINISKNKLNKYNFYVSLGPNYYSNSQSVLNDFRDSRWGVNASSSSTIYLIKRIIVDADINYTFNEETVNFSEVVNPLICNLTVSEVFLKDQSLKLSISGKDLLNQNIGFSRTPFSQTSFTTIRRYFMGSATWNFNKMGSKL